MSSADHAGWRSRGYLPHLDAPELVQHLVFRLADSLPARFKDEIIGCPPATRAEALDAALDQGLGRRDLAIPEIAALVQRALLRFNGDRYALIAWCVMPNHVHSLIETREGHRLDRIVHSWKSYTAKKANRLLDRAGPFWAPEYFDRYMRDNAHLAATRAYIEANPVKAGLCRDASDWPFSSVSMQ
ncbi:MAG TPA: transposase [Stellaceae bacterium]|jgi:REP element-mobilizing transposase RayT